MMNRVVVNICDEGAEVVVSVDEFSFEIWNKQAAFTVVEFVNGFRVRIEEI